MAAEPLNLFATRADLAGALAVLRGIDPDAAVVGPEDDWTEVTVGPPGGTLSIRHDPAYDSGPGWPRQLDGMRGYFARFPEGPRKPDVLRLIGAFRLALAVDLDPEPSDLDDPRLGWVSAVARRLDAAIFRPSGLLDADFRPLLVADGDHDPDARLPAIPEEVAPDDDDDEIDADEIDDEIDADPPDAARVARRALALAAVSARGLIESSAPPGREPEGFRRDLIGWVEAAGAADEVEPDEWQALQRPVGRLEPQSSIDATWRLEGLAVLAWALGRFDLPPVDELAGPSDLFDAVGLNDAAAARRMVESAELRPDADLHEHRQRSLGVHWRLRDFRIRPEAIDFAAFAEKCWFGPFDLGPIRLIDDDLALGEDPIGRAPADRVGRAESSSRERHLAANWLALGGTYSQTDTST